VPPCFRRPWQGLVVGSGGAEDRGTVGVRLNVTVQVGCWASTSSVCRYLLFSFVPWVSLLAWVSCKALRKPCPGTALALGKRKTTEPSSCLTRQILINMSWVVFPAQYALSVCSFGEAVLRFSSKMLLCSIADAEWLLCPLQRGLIDPCIYTHIIC